MLAIQIKKKTYHITGMLFVSLAVMLGISISFLTPQDCFAFDDDKGAQDYIEFAKIDENGELIDNVTFKYTSSDGKGILDRGLMIHEDYRQTQNTGGMSPSQYNLMSRVYLQVTHQYFGVEYADGSSNDSQPFRDLDALITMEEVSVPDNYMPMTPITIRYSGTTTPNRPDLNYGLTVTGEALTKTITKVDDDYRPADCLTEDPGGVATNAFKEKYAHNRRNWPDFLIVNYPKVKIAKKEEGGAYLKGAVFEITGTTSKGHAIKKKTITSEEAAVSIGLPSGRYVLHEVTPPEGYELAADIEFEVANGKVLINGDEVDEVVMTDPKKEEPGKPILSVKKTSNVKSASPGDVIPYVITVTNKGNADADDVVVLDTMNNNLTYVSDDSNGKHDGQRVSWNVQVPAGATKTININCRINESAVGKVINNVVITNVESEYIEPSESSDQFEVVLGEADEPVEETVEETETNKTEPPTAADDKKETPKDKSSKTGDPFSPFIPLIMGFLSAASAAAIRRRKVR